MSAWETVLGASALAAAVGVLARSGVRDEAPFLSIQQRWLVRAALPGSSPGPPRRLRRARAALRHRLVLWQLRRMVPRPWAEAMRPVHIRLENTARACTVAVSRDWELDLYVSSGSFARLQRQVAGVGAAVLLLSAIAGRVASFHRPPAPPQAAYDPAFPGGGRVSVLGSRWYAASLASPSVHAFQTATPTGPAANATEAYSAKHTTWSGYTSATPYPHTNTPFSHTNTDTRPLSGPL